MKQGKFEAKRVKPATPDEAAASQAGQGRFEAKAPRSAAPEQAESTEQGRFEAKAPKAAASGQTESTGRGKFEAKAAKAAEPVQEERQAKGRKLPRWLLITLLALLVLGLGGTQLYWFLQPAPADEYPGALTKEETLERYRSLAQVLEHEDMNLTLFPNDSASQDVPILLTLSPAQSRVMVDLAGLEQDLNEGVGKVGRGRYRMDPARYVSLDRSALRELAERTERDWDQTYLPSFAAVSSYREGPKEGKVLTVNIGRRGRDISADVIYDTLLEAYLTGDMAPTLNYETYIPKPLDVEEICDRFRTDPIDAVLDETTFEITPEVPGLGVNAQELTRVLNYAHEGIGYTIPLGTLTPKVTTAKIEAKLYEHILGEAHTPHTRIDDRTTNLILACEQIDGTVVMPGEIFSFNETVGERTEEKGYREATAYIAGNSVPEIGGGVCQVASSIYYATLQADLPSVERHAHTYLVTYVPQGMDAAIYWEQLDFKFENVSPYPIKIRASVSDGEVHILLRGREWKDYTVELSYKVLDETPWSTKEQAVYDDSYKTGDVIVSPYTGYLIATYKSLYDLEGNLIETVQIAYSRYAKRDKVVAVRVWSQPPGED